MKFYVSMRPILLSFGNERKLITPNDHIRDGFTGLNISLKNMASNQNIDGRWLYEITLDPSYTDQQNIDYKSIILEGLQLFSCHEKTLDSAKALAELITGITWNINGDSIEPDVVEE